MPTIISDAFCHVIQPIKLNVATKNFSVTYAFNAPNLGDAQTMLDACFSRFKTRWGPAMDNSFTMLPSIGYYRNPGGSLSLLQAAGASAAGAVNANSPTAQVACVLRKRTAFVGKAHRGRMFFPGLLSESSVDEAGLIGSAGVTAIQTIATAWLGDFGTQSGMPPQMRLLHSDPGLFPSVVTSLVVQPIVRTQRRRLPRG